MVALIGCREVVIIPTNIKPLYRELAEFGHMNQSQRDSVMTVFGHDIDLMMAFLGKDSVSEDMLIEWSYSPTVKMFMPAVDSVFPSLDPLQNTFGLILANASSENIRIPDYEYVATVWNSRKSIVIADTTVMIALNHFLGEDFVGYSSWEKYLRPDKTPTRLPYALTEALIATNYPYHVTENSTILSRMMYEGAMIYIKLKIIPSATLSDALGYTTDELEWLDRHYKEMWETVIGKDIIYSTSSMIAKRLFDPAPNSSILSQEYPGRVGRYIGYRIVLDYMENNAKTDLPFLLSPEFYNNPAVLVLAQ